MEPTGSREFYVILIAYEGEAKLQDAAGNEVLLQAGESILLPASNSGLTIEPQGITRFSCVETFIR